MKCKTCDGPMNVYDERWERGSGIHPDAWKCVVFLAKEIRRFKEITRSRAGC